MTSVRLAVGGGPPWPPPGDAPEPELDPEPIDEAEADPVGGDEPGGVAGCTERAAAAVSPPPYLCWSLLPPFMIATVDPTAAPTALMMGVAISWPPRLGVPLMRLEAMWGARQVRNMRPQAVRNIAKSSFSGMSGLENFMLFLRTGSIAERRKLIVMSLIPTATTAPIAFSARNLVLGRTPKGTKIPTSAVMR
jgi:hypothetical protein